MESFLDESRLNPLSAAAFAERLEQVIASKPLQDYTAATSMHAGSPSQALMRRRLKSDLAKRAGETVGKQLELMSDDALSTFKAELAVLIATSASYERAAKRLVRRSHARFVNDAKAVLPKALRSYERKKYKHADGGGAATGGGIGGSTLLAAPRRASVLLRKAMAAEASSHVAEAAELPPREQDVAPPPWWKQILAQVLGMGLNLLQAYLLQHLPAKRRERRDEKMMPRAPLF